MQKAILKSGRISSVQQAPIIICKTLSYIILLYFYRINKIGYFAINFCRKTSFFFSLFLLAEPAGIYRQASG